MATHPDMIRPLDPPRTQGLRDARVRRWCWFALAGALGLALYVGSLSWAARELEAGVERSIQPLPVMLRDNPAID